MRGRFHTTVEESLRISCLIAAFDRRHHGHHAYPLSLRTRTSLRMSLRCRPLSCRPRTCTATIRCALVLILISSKVDEFHFPYSFIYSFSFMQFLQTITNSPFLHTFPSFSLSIVLHALVQACTHIYAHCTSILWAFPFVKFQIGDATGFFSLVFFHFFFIFRLVCEWFFMFMFLLPLMVGNGVCSHGLGVRFETCERSMCLFFLPLPCTVFFDRPSI